MYYNIFIILLSVFSTAMASLTEQELEQVTENLEKVLSGPFKPSNRKSFNNTPSEESVPQAPAPLRPLPLFGPLMTPERTREELKRDLLAFVQEQNAFIDCKPGRVFSSEKIQIFSKADVEWFTILHQLYEGDLRSDTDDLEAAITPVLPSLMRTITSCLDAPDTLPTEYSLISDASDSEDTDSETSSTESNPYKSLPLFQSVLSAPRSQEDLEADLKTFIYNFK